MEPRLFLRVWVGHGCRPWSRPLVSVTIRISVRKSTLTLNADETLEVPCPRPKTAGLLNGI